MSYTLYNVSKRIVCVLLTSAILLTVGGCGSIMANYREIATLQPVQTLGFDSFGNSVRATISTGKGTEGEKATLISRSSRSIPESLDSIQDYSSKNQLFFEQTQFLLIGEDAAKRGVSELYDFLERGNILRLDNAMFLVRAGTAEDIIVGSGGENYDITGSISTIETDVEKRGEGFPYNCREILRAENEYGSALVCAVIAESLSDSVFSEEAEVTAIPAGFAVLKDGKLVDYIEKENCPLGANILLNKSGKSFVSLSDGETSTAQLTLTDSKCSYKAQWKDNRLEKISAKVDISAAVISAKHDIGNPSPEYLAFLKNRLENETKLRCESVLEQSRRLSCDFLGLAGEIRSQDPVKFSRMDKAFASALADIEFDVEVNAQIAKTFTVQTSPFAGKEG